MKIENGYYIRNLDVMPYDKAFILKDGNEQLCHATGIEVCDIKEDPNNLASWWNEYEDVYGNLHYGR